MWVCVRVCVWGGGGEKTCAHQGLKELLENSRRGQRSGQCNRGVQYIYNIGIYIYILYILHALSDIYDLT